MKRRTFFKSLTAGGSLLSIPPIPLQARKKSKPNIVIIMADDLGFADISCHDGNTPTPYIDSLFKSGIELTQFMTWCVCSPTRAGLLTGINPLKIHQGPCTDGELDPNIMTIGRAFQNNGYKTGIFGKWHNGMALNAKVRKPGPGVNAYGFDRWVGFHGGGCDYFTHVHGWEPDRPNWWHDNKYMPDEKGYVTDLLTDHAIQFIDKNKNDNFLCYIPYSVVHTPFHAKLEDIKRVPKKLLEKAGGKLRTWKEYYKLYNDKFKKDFNETYMKLTGDTSIKNIQGKMSHEEKLVLYSAMLINLDDNVGKILKYLKDNGLYENTIVWFFSDNGGFTWFTDNRPYKMGKHSLWEGGIRTASVVKWPGDKLVGPRKYNGLTGFLDVYPTCMSMAGLELPDKDKIDGKDCYSTIKNNTKSPVNEYYYLWREHDMIRTDQWKLFRSNKKSELYNVKQDIGENHNVIDKHPEIAKALEKKLDDFMKKNKISSGHLPGNKGNAKPKGKVLEVEVEVEASKKTSVIRLEWLNEQVHLQTNDRLEYDIYIAEDSITEGFHIGPVFFNKSSLFKNDKSCDNYNQLYTKNYSYKIARNKWKRIITGLATNAPRLIFPVGLFIAPKKKGKIHFYLDNLIVRRDTGNKVFWTSGKPKGQDPQLKNIKIRNIRTVDLNKI